MRRGDRHASVVYQVDLFRRQHLDYFRGTVGKPATMVEKLAAIHLLEELVVCLEAVSLGGDVEAVGGRRRSFVVRHV